MPSATAEAHAGPGNYGGTRVRCAPVGYGSRVSDLLLRDVRLGDEPGLPTADLLVRDGRITARGPGLESPEDVEGLEIVDAGGLVALPGAIDAYARLADARTPQAPADDMGSGSIAAARGGVTTIVAPAVPGSGDTVASSFAAAVGRTTGNVFVDWGLIVGLGRPTPESAAQLSAVAGEPGMLGAFLDLDAVDEAATAGPGAILRIAAVAGQPIAVHLGGALGPTAERRRLETLASLGALADVAPFAAPIASAAALEALGDGLITGATSLAHLCLDALPEGATVRPPLGDAADRDALWAALADGRLAGVVSDHRNEPMNGKEGWIGIASIEMLLPALLTHGVAAGRIDLPTLCAIAAERPARQLGIWPRKGSLQVGADGDIVLVDPDATWTVDPAQLEGRGKAPVWHDREMTGRVVHVFSRGQQIVNDGFPLFRPGRGRPVVRVA